MTITLKKRPKIEIALPSLKFIGRYNCYIFKINIIFNMKRTETIFSRNNKMLPSFISKAYFLQAVKSSVKQ